MELDLRGELAIGGAWVDATGRILTRQSLTHTRGRPDQGARVDPSTLRPLLNNTDGRFSPDNPNGPYYGQFGRNTPFRFSLRAGTPFLELPGSSAAVASTPDTAALDIALDIDVRVDATLSNWTTYTASLNTTQFVGKLGNAAGTKSWLFGTRDGALYFEWSADGTNALSASSTVPLPLPASGHLAVRATLDADNGAGGRIVTFYTAPSGTSGPWTQLGDAVVQSGTTSIFNSAIALRIGRATDVSFTQPIGRVHKAEVRNGINGALVAAPDFSVQTVGATSFVDGAGLTWTVSSPASISNRRTRLSHELAAYPTEWHPSGKHAWVDATTAGILRRLRRGEHALDSTLRRRIPSFGPLAYWPMEEGANATQAYSPIPRVRPLRLTRVNWAQADSLASSNPLPVLASSGGDLPEMLGRVPAPATTLTAWHVQWVYRLDQGPATARTFMRILSTGTAAEWYIQSGTGGSNLLVKDSDGGTIISQPIGTGSDLFGQWVRVRLEIAQVGGNVEWAIVWTDVGGDSGAVESTFPGTIGRPTGVASPPNGFSSDLSGMAIGHISVWSTEHTDAYNGAIDAWTGETAGERMQRLAEEETIPLAVCGVVAEQTLVGPQRPDAVLNLLEEAAEADGGILYEDREQPTLRYRDRAGMYNQTPALVLDYNAPGLAPPLRPPGDDDGTENDVTVTRVGGSSGRAVLEEGPMSVQAPPNGVGTGYDSSYPLNLHSDEQTEPHAYWRMWLGTYEGRRYPQVHVMVHQAPELADQILAVDVGDKIVIKNPPKWVAPGDIELIVQGYEETWTTEFAWDIVFNCTPGRPWTVGVVEDIALAWVDTDGSELASAATATANTLDVLTTNGLVWWTDPADTPFDLTVGGEEVRVTAGGRLVNVNPFFDTDVVGWSPQNSTRERSTAVVHPQGQGSLLITPDNVASFGGATCDAIPVQPGVPYTVSMWAYSPTGATGIQPMADWFTSGGSYISSSTTPGGFTVPAGQWTFLRAAFTAPATAGNAILWARYDGTPGTLTPFYVWAVRITQTKAASWLHDSFGRTASSTWSTADSGQTWQTGGGTAADYSVTGGYGSHVLATVGASRRSFVTFVYADFDTYVSVTTSVLATGGSLYGGPTGRHVDSQNLYQARVAFTTSNTMVLNIIKLVAGVETVLGTYTLPGTYTAGTFVRVRFQGSGSTLRAKAWLATGQEPGAWHVEVTDTSITTSGFTGLRSISASGNTNTNPEIRYDNLDLINPQVVSVDRSRNGVVKAQTAGTDVLLAYPTIVAL